MALFKINRGSAKNLPTTKTEGYMYITEDVGDIYVDLSASKRIRLNAEAAEKIRKITYNDDGSYKSEVSFSYDQLKAIHNSLSDNINTKLDKIMPQASYHMTIGSLPVDIGSNLPGTNLSIGIYNNEYARSIISPNVGITENLEVSFATGDGSIAYGAVAWAEGNGALAGGAGTTAYGEYSVALGKQTWTDGQASMAIGVESYALGEGSLAAGYSSYAQGKYSLAEGYETRANGEAQHVQGKYNIPDTTSVHIVGNGTSTSKQSNAHTLDSSGNAWFSGDVYVGSTSGTNKDDGSKKLATEDAVASAKTELETKIGTNTDAINTINTTTIPAAKTYAEEKATAAYNDAIKYADGLYSEHETDISNLTNTVSANKTELEGKISANTTLINNLKYAGSDTVGGNAIKANTVNITCPSSFTDAAAAVPLFTEKIFFWGSDGLTAGAPVNYVIVNVKKGANGRTIADCYALQTGAHYINGCMNSGHDSTQTSTYNVWTGWRLQPGFDDNGHFVPSATDTYNIGSTSLEWDNVYANNFHGNLNGTIGGFTVAKSVPSNAVFTDTNTTNVGAGNGLTGGGSAASTSGVTLNVGAGVGIAVAADAVKAKLRSETALTVDSAAATTTSGRVYPVAVDKTGYLAVNVPWTDNNTTYSIATASTAGLVKPISVITKPTINSASTTSGKYYPVQMSSDGNMFVNVPWTDTNTNTTYSAGNGLTLSGTTFNVGAGTGISVAADAISLSASGVTAGTYGPSANVTGSNNATISVPEITVDTYGRVTKVTNRTYTSVNTDTNTNTEVTQTVTTTNAAYPLLLAPSGQTATTTTTSYFDSGVTLNPSTNTIAANISGSSASCTGNAATATTASACSGNSVTATTATNATNVYINSDTSSKIYVLGATTTGNTKVYRESSVYMQSNVLYGAAWNDYAEYRETTETVEPGRVICENGDDTLSLAIERMQPGASVVSDTFGFAIGETEIAKTPIAVSGRVLVYTYEDRNSYKPGDAVCAAPNGTVSKMTREEIREYPERIVGTVSAIPEYETWGEGDVPVNGRIWIKVR